MPIDYSAPQGIGFYNINGGNNSGSDIGERISASVRSALAPVGPALNKMAQDVSIAVSALGKMGTQAIRAVGPIGPVSSTGTMGNIPNYNAFAGMANVSNFQPIPRAMPFIPNLPSYIAPEVSRVGRLATAGIAGASEAAVLAGTYHLLGRSAITPIAKGLGATFGAGMGSGTAFAMGQRSLPSLLKAGTAGRALGSGMGWLSGSIVEFAIINELLRGTVGQVAQGIMRPMALEQAISPYQKSLFASGAGSGRLGGLSKREMNRLGIDMSRIIAKENPFVRENAMGILQTGLETNYFGVVRDTGDFKRKFKDLTKAAEEVAMTLNTTVEEGVRTVSNLKKMGIKSPGAIRRTLYETGARAAMAGMSFEQMEATRLQGAEAFRGTGISMKLGGDIATSMMARSRYAATTGTITDRILNQLGGAAGVGQLTSNAQQQFMMGSDFQNLLLAAVRPGGKGLNMEALNSFISGEMPLPKYLSRIGGLSAQDKLAFSLRKGELAGQLSSEQVLGLQNRYFAAQAAVLPGGATQDNMAIAMMQQGYTAEQAQAFLATSNPEAMARFKTAQKIEARNVAKQRALTERERRGGIFSLGWQAFRKFISPTTDLFRDVGHAIKGEATEAGIAFTEAYNKYVKGIETFREVDITADESSELIKQAVAITEGAMPTAVEEKQRSGWEKLRLRKEQGELAKTIKNYTAVETIKNLEKPEDYRKKQVAKQFETTFEAMQGAYRAPTEADSITKLWAKIGNKTEVMMENEKIADFSRKHLVKRFGQDATKALDAMEDIIKGKKKMGYGDLAQLEKTMLPMFKGDKEAVRLFLKENVIPEMELHDMLDASNLTDEIKKAEDQLEDIEDRGVGPIEGRIRGVMGIRSVEDKKKLVSVKRAFDAIDKSLGLKKGVRFRRFAEEAGKKSKSVLYERLTDKEKAALKTAGVDEEAYRGLTTQMLKRGFLSSRDVSGRYISDIGKIEEQMRAEDRLELLHMVRGVPELISSAKEETADIRSKLKGVKDADKLNAILNAQDIAQKMSKAGRRLVGKIAYEGEITETLAKQAKEELGISLEKGGAVDKAMEKIILQDVAAKKKFEMDKGETAEITGGGLFGGIREALNDYVYQTKRTANALDKLVGIKEPLTD